MSAERPADPPPIPLGDYLRTTSIVALLRLRADGSVVDANRAAARYLGHTPNELVGRSLLDHVAAGDANRLRTWLAGEPLPRESIPLNFTDIDGSPFTLRCTVLRTDDGIRIVGEPAYEEERPASDELMRLNNELATMARERARQQRELSRLRDELETALHDLRSSYWHLQKIQEFLPVCMECGKIKTDGARWQSIVEYLRENEIFMSHGYCPDCGTRKLAEWELS